MCRGQGEVARGKGKRAKGKGKKGREELGTWSRGEGKGMGQGEMKGER